MRKEHIVPWALIIIGSTMLLHQIGWFSFTGSKLIIFASLLLGILLFLKGFQNPVRKGVFGGAFFIILGTWLAMMEAGFLPTDDYLAAGLFIATLGAANLIFFLFRPVHISNLVVGIILMLTAMPLMAYYYGYFRYWQFEHYYTTYWPVALILIGSGLMIDVIIKKYHKQS